MRILIFILFVFSFSGITQAQTGLAITTSAQRMLSTLPADIRKQAVFAFGDTMRLKWTNLPVGLVPRPGVQYGSLSDSSRLAVHELFTTVLSSRGYLKLTSIMQLDDILNVLYKDALDTKKIDEKTYQQIRNLNWAHGNYYLSFWGEPLATEPWGFNFGGHHMALNITVTGAAVSFSPFFIGTDPSQVKSLKYAGWRILSKEEDYGFMLLNLLSEKQKKTAVLSQEVPGDIITNPNSIQRIDKYYGLSAKDMNADQLAMLKILIQEYTHDFEHDMAGRFFDRITASGMDKVYFAWIGSSVRNQPHYYVINGPDFLIEYDNVGFQKDGNHIHAILREKGGDFGADVLKEHYAKSGHHKN
jgi:hypothetical protein